jgi:hypothetical protein
MGEHSIDRHWLNLARGALKPAFDVSFTIPEQDHAVGLCTCDREAMDVAREPHQGPALAEQLGAKCLLFGSTGC